MTALRTAVIMAGGEGVRLRPLTYAIPKPLLPVGPYTVLEHLVSGLASQGVSDLRVLASYRFDRFESAVAPYAERYGVEVRLEREVERLGTMGGIAALADELSAPFLLVNADLVLEADFQAMHAAHVERGSWLTIGVKPFIDTVPYGVVSADGGAVVDLVEKPAREHVVSVGAYIVSPEALSYLGGERADVPDVVARLLADGRPVRAHELDGLWLDVGQADDYERAVRVLDDVEARFEGRDAGDVRG